MISVDLVMGWLAPAFKSKDGNCGMKHRDLGILDGPLLLFGGPYSNAQALEALVAEADAFGLGPEQMICTGDIVAYCGAPKRCVAQMRDLGCAVVAGNCEIQLGQGAQECGCGFEAGSACDLLSVGWYGFASQMLNRDDKAWMAALPDIISFVHQGARYAVIHGGVSDVARFIWPGTDATVLEDEIALIGQAIGPVDHVIAGHCGIPFVAATSTGRWINAGVIGMPPHDGCQQTRYVLLEEGAVQIRRLTYDVEGAGQDMMQAGLPQGYRDGLHRGYWPSEDILPAELRRPSLASG
jgi:predicted phosphodiesterase